MTTRLRVSSATALFFAFACGCKDSPPPPPAQTFSATGQAATDREGERPSERRLALARTEGKLEAVAAFDGAMPTGVTVSRTGRMFVNFPRWGDPVEFTVAEVKDGKPVPFPNAEINRVPPPEKLEVLGSYLQSMQWLQASTLTT